MKSNTLINITGIQCVIRLFNGYNFNKNVSFYLIFNLIKDYINI